MLSSCEWLSFAKASLLVVAFLKSYNNFCFYSLCAQNYLYTNNQYSKIQTWCFACTMNYCEWASSNYYNTWIGEKKKPSWSKKSHDFDLFLFYFCFSSVSLPSHSLPFFFYYCLVDEDTVHYAKQNVLMFF